MPVEHRHYEDQVHGFFGMGILADSLALSIEVCDAMGRLMHRDGALPAPGDPGRRLSRSRSAGRAGSPVVGSRP